MLHAIVERNVAGGSHIYSDEWSAYWNIASRDVRKRWRPVTNQQLPYVHFTVNHSLFFVDPVTGAHTQLAYRN